MYLNPSCILQRENSPRSSVKVDSGPVKENTRVLMLLKLIF